jgi:hypothetical protein
LVWLDFRRATRGSHAASVLPDAIEASEAAYLRLRLRLRATFYLPTVGASQPFVQSGWL